MALSVNKIQEAFVRTLNTLVGKDACPSRQQFTSPVITPLGGGIRPPYPFVVVGKAPLLPYGHTGTYDEYYDDNGNLTRLTNYRVDIPITVHGDGGNPDIDVVAIAREIRDTLFREYGKLKLFEEFEAGLLEITSPNYSFQYLNTDYEETSRIVVSLSATDVFVEDDPNCPSTPVITTVTTDGTVEGTS